MKKTPSNCSSIMGNDIKKASFSSRNDFDALPFYRDSCSVLEQRNYSSYSKDELSVSIQKEHDRNAFVFLMLKVHPVIRKSGYPINLSDEAFYQFFEDVWTNPGSWKSVMSSSNPGNYVYRSILNKAAYLCKKQQYRFENRFVGTNSIPADKPCSEETDYNSTKLNLILEALNHISKEEALLIVTYYEHKDLKNNYDEFLNELCTKADLQGIQITGDLTYANVQNNRIPRIKKKLINYININKSVNYGLY